MTSILQIGANGQVASELRRQLAASGVAHQVLARPELDMAEPASVERAIDAAEPFDILINCAAYTAVDRAEEEEELARAVNALSVEAAARACKRRGAAMIHISTDYVFDGEKDGAYTEDDPVAPIGAYGRTKLEGEQRLADVLERFAIVRTAWVYSHHGNNFVKTMLRVGRERDALRVVDDQHGCPTQAGDIARMLVAVAGQMDKPGAGGIYHYCGAGETSWCGFAREIFEQTAGWAFAAPHVEAIETKDYPTPARRPKNSVLSTSKIERQFAIEPRDWRDALAETLQELARNEDASHHA